MRAIQRKGREVRTFPPNLDHQRQGFYVSPKISIELDRDFLSCARQHGNRYSLQHVDLLGLVENKKSDGEVNHTSLEMSRDASKKISPEYARYAGEYREEKLDIRALKVCDFVSIFETVRTMSAVSRTPWGRRPRIALSRRDEWTERAEKIVACYPLRMKREALYCRTELIRVHSRHKMHARQGASSCRKLRAAEHDPPFADLDGHATVRGRFTHRILSSKEFVMASHRNIPSHLMLTHLRRMQKFYLVENSSFLLYFLYYARCFPHSSFYRSDG